MNDEKHPVMAADFISNHDLLIHCCSLLTG